MTSPLWHFRLGRDGHERPLLTPTHSLGVRTAISYSPPGVNGCGVKALVAHVLLEPAADSPRITRLPPKSWSSPYWGLSAVSINNRRVTTTDGRFARHEGACFQQQTPRSKRSHRTRWLAFKPGSCLYVWGRSSSVDKRTANSPRPLRSLKVTANIYTPQVSIPEGCTDHPPLPTGHHLPGFTTPNLSVLNIYTYKVLL